MPFDRHLRNSRAAGAHHPSAQLACEVDGFGDADERVGGEQPARRVLPAHQRLEREDLAGAHVDLGQIVQDQGAVLDRALQMQLDVVAELALERHVVGEHRDLVSAAALGGEQRLVGAAQQVRGGVAAGHAERDADADRAGEHLAVDGHPLAQRRLQLAGEGLGFGGAHRRHRDDDELVAAEAGDQVGSLGAFPRAVWRRPG